MMKKQSSQTKHDDLVDLARELDLEVGPHLRTREKRSDGVLMEEEIGYVTAEGIAELAKALDIELEFGDNRSTICGKIADEVGFEGDPLRGGDKDTKASFIKDVRRSICGQR